MELLLKRRWKKATYTIGQLFVNGQYFSNTIEDKDRGLRQDMPLAEIKAKKIYAQTAIPTGRYKVAMHVTSPKMSQKTVYAKYKGKLPRLIDVPGYEGILIHIGNKATHSAGCILVGENTKVGMVLNSQKTFYRLMDEFLVPARDRREDIFITIE